jgi:hypothetical protein
MFDVEKRAVQTPRVEEPNSWRFKRGVLSPRVACVWNDTV